MTDKAIEISIREQALVVWGYARENCNSLDKDKAFKVILGAFAEATSAIQSLFDAEVVKNAVLRLEIKELKKELESREPAKEVEA